MTDYYPLISRVVADLEKNTAETRRALYERARQALIEQLHGLDPPMSASEITRERLALEEAVRKVEAENAHLARAARSLRSQIASTVRSPDTASTPPAAHSESRAPEPSPEPDHMDEALAGERRAPTGIEPQSAPLEDEAYHRTHDQRRQDPIVQDPNVADHWDEDRHEQEPLDQDQFEADAEADIESVDRTGSQQDASLQEHPRSADAPRHSPLLQPRPALFGVADDIPMGHSRKGLIAASLAVFALLLLVGAAYWERDAIRGWFGSAKTAVNQPQNDAAPQRPKITDRVGQSGQFPAPGSTTGDQNAPEASSPPRIILTEEDPNDPAGKRFSGSITWRTETVSPGPGLPPEVAIKGDMEIPERGVTISMSLRRNSDKTLPASHTIEVVFNLPANFPAGGITNVPGILMKQSEQNRGAPLAGLTVKVTPSFFLIGLAADSNMEHNIQLLKEREWFDVPIVYNNGRRAILAIEKGAMGDRAFSDAFAAWGQ